MRYPHLSDCEHGIRKVLQSKECEEWFNGTDTIVSSHDLISEVLQADWDGDHICLVHDKAFMDVLERDKYPLFYDMTKAESAQITNNAVMNCLISSFQNENIGFVSNAITKIFNSEGDPDTKLVRVLCAYNNFVIDYFKTQKSMDLQQYTFIYEEYKDSDKHKCPHFFMYAKDKKQKQCEKSNLNGNADRISKYISDKTSNGIAKVNYSSKDAFNPEMLKNSDIKVDRTSEKYSQLRRLLLDLKREHSAWYKKVKDDLNAKESEKQLFNIYCGAKVKEIFPDRKEAANYLVDIEYHTEENQEEKKDILWNCYGDILYDNLCKNVDSDITPKVKRNVYQKSVDREKEILESRDRIKKEQEEIVKVLITKTVYDDLMGIKVRKGCEKDRYILYILYVLIRRFQAKYGEEKEYIRIYKGLRQKSKITAATIDNWIDSKCTQKGLDRLEKNKYIRREHMQNYDKVYLRELPETDVSDIVFDAESNNPLLKNEYIIDFEKLYLDTEKDYFVKMFVEEIQQILLLEESIKKKMSLLKYFIVICSTFNWSKDMGKYQGKISGMSLEYFADLTGISSKTCNRYNIILEKNHLLFVYRSNDKMKNFDGTMRQINNCYSRYCDKELCIAYATDYENRYGYEHKIVQTRKNKEEADKNRRLAAIYNRICEGHEYPIEVVREVQKYIRNKNQYLQKLIDEKKAQSYMAFSEKEWVARLESQLRDESVFLQAKLESDCEFESNIWGEPNPLDIFIEEAV